MTGRHWTTVRAGALSFRLDESGTECDWQADGLPLRSVDRADFWTMSVEHGDLRDVPVRSSRQQGTVTETDGGLLVDYPNLVTDNGDVLDIRFAVRVAAIGDELSWTASGTVGDDARVDEVTLPLVALQQGCSADRADDVMYIPDGLGRQIRDPWRAVARGHTEYMVADQKGIWSHAAYPGELSMAWQGLHTGGHFLYLGRHDPEFRATLLSVGTSGRDGPTHLALCATALPRAGRDTSFEVPAVVVSLMRGDWRDGAHRYRRWADTWYTGPADPSVMADIHGWQRVILKHQYGEILHTYDDLVTLYEQGRECGLRMLLVFGWWKTGFDRGYPAYEADDALGGADALRRAITRIEARGGVVALYANGILIDRNSSFYRDHGHEAAKKGVNGFEYVDDYRFADEAKATRHFSNPDFALACHAAPVWRAKLVDIARTKMELGARWIFFDQMSYHRIAWPCSDSAHEHGTSPDTEATYRRRSLEQIRELDAGLVVGSEGVNDSIIPMLNYNHGLGFAHQHVPEAFPFLFREVFPEPTISNRFVHDDQGDWERQLHYALVFNLVFDVGLYRSRAGIAELPRYADKIAELVELRRMHRDFFRGGRFSAPDQDWIDGDLVHTRYVTDRAALDVYWNPTGSPVQVGACDVTLEPNGLHLTVT